METRAREGRFKDLRTPIKVKSRSTILKSMFQLAQLTHIGTDTSVGIKSPESNKPNPFS